MKVLITQGMLGLAALLATACGAVDQGDTAAAVEIDEVGEALTSSYMQSGSMLFMPFTLSQNCTLNIETSSATSSRDPILGLIINNGSPSAWGSSTMPCNHHAPSATEGYTTLAFGDNINSSNYNAKLSYKNTNGGAALTVFAVGVIKEQINTPSTSYGQLPVQYSVTGCNNASDNVSGTINQDFQASAKQAAYPGYIYSVEPRPGGPRLRATPYSTAWIPT